MSCIIPDIVLKPTEQSGDKSKSYWENCPHHYKVRINERTIPLSETESLSETEYYCLGGNVRFCVGDDIKALSLNYKIYLDVQMEESCIRHCKHKKKEH